MRQESLGTAALNTNARTCAHCVSVGAATASIACAACKSSDPWASNTSQLQVSLTTASGWPQASRRPAAGTSQPGRSGGWQTRRQRPHRGRARRSGRGAGAALRGRRAGTSGFHAAPACSLSTSIRQALQPPLRTPAQSHRRGCGSWSSGPGTDAPRSIAPGRRRHSRADQT